MILNYTINTNIEITKLEDMAKLKVFNDNANIKVNFSEIGRSLGKDRRTVKKYYDGYEKPKTRKKVSKCDEYYDTIVNLLNNKHKTFSYIINLYNYLKNKCNMNIPYSTFRYYICKNEKLYNYFKNTPSKSPIRQETEIGSQAQVDWKENISFTLKNGETIKINVLTVLLSYSRFRVYRLSISKTRESLMHLLDESFEILGGVPKELLVDNTATIMKEPRTHKSDGVVNPEFEHFAKEYGFNVKPCMVRTPNTKGKVEAQMKILDEIKSYSGDLDLQELVNLIQKLNDRENGNFHKGYNKIPILAFEKEKDFLQPLPTNSIRSQFKRNLKHVKVNNSSLVCFKNNLYSVPTEFIGKTVSIQEIDESLYIYYSTLLVAVHTITTKKLNYHLEHHTQTLRVRFKYKSDEEIREMAKNNLKMIGDSFL